MGRPKTCDLCGKEGELREYRRPSGFSGYLKRWWDAACYAEAKAQDAAWEPAL